MVFNSLWYCWIGYITDLWIKLLNAVCYTIVFKFLKRDIIALLLELYMLKQITSHLLIETCLNLWWCIVEEMRLKSFVIILYMEIVISNFMNLLVITNVNSHWWIYNSLHKIMLIVHSSVYAHTYISIYTYSCTLWIHYHWFFRSNTQVSFLFFLVHYWYSDVFVSKCTKRYQLSSKSINSLLYYIEICRDIHLQAGYCWVNIIGKFYLDMEFTNRNYYLADILEIALLVWESESAFHSYRPLQEFTSVSTSKCE